MMSVSAGGCAGAGRPSFEGGVGAVAACRGTYTGCDDDCGGADGTALPFAGSELDAVDSFCCARGWYDGMTGGFTVSLPGSATTAGLTGIEPVPAPAPTSPFAEWASLGDGSDSGVPSLDASKTFRTRSAPPSMLFTRLSCFPCSWPLRIMGNALPPVVAEPVPVAVLPAA